MLRKIYLFVASLLCAAALNAQVTTSSITGTVKDIEGQPLVGATVELTHLSTGTVYRATSRAGGVFDIQNINPGGPYAARVSYIGYSDFNQSDINVPLGEQYSLTASMSTATQELTEVVVTGAGSRTEKMGAATNVSRAQIVNLPNMNRSLLDVSKVTPQANGSSFLGMSNRFNNITVDGSVFNNNFGLGANPLPGGASQPISIDAIDQMQVNLAPYDVRQAGFTGAGINAVTRRGTNDLYVTVYDYFRNQNFNGRKVDKQELPAFLKSSSNILGASVGAPIIKNKLFLFVNGEYEKVTLPGQLGVAKGSGGTNNVLDNVNASDMDAMGEFLKTKYNYDPGAYQGYDFFTTNKKFLARLDWNINSNHRLALRYNLSQTSDDVPTNASSGPNPRFNNGRNGGTSSVNGLNFINSNYKMNNNVYSIVGELNSKISNFSNQFLASYTKVHDYRETPGGQFPFVDIMRDPSNVLMTFGSEIYSYQNYVKNNTINISDNLSLNIGRHSLLFGTSFDYLTFENSFANYGGQSYYRFASMSDFMNNAAPTVFAVTYSNTDRAGVAPAKANFAQLGFYAQDVFTVSDRFKLTYGARIDLPFYPGEKVSNNALAAITLKNPQGNDFKADVGTWPEARLLVSPRVGLTYDILEDKSLVFRGGTGIFTGRIPFVWLVNQSSDNGVLNSMVTYTGTAAAPLNNYKFNPDRTAHVPQTLPTTIGILPGAYYSVTSPGFKIPQVWRSNIALDKTFGDGFTATLEGIFSKTLNAVYHYNANLGTVKGQLFPSGDTRNVYNSALTSEVGQVFVMDNTSKGSSFALTAQLQKRFSNNWNGSIAYTYAVAKDVSPNNGDRSQSSWTQNAIINNPNDPELGYSAYSIPHRLTAFGSYRFEYANKNLASTISLFYSGGSQGRYLYRYGADINGDRATNDLLYVPASRDGLEQQFVAITDKDKNGVVIATYTPAQQADAYWTFIQNDEYLSSKTGQYVERFGALMPWVNQLDLRFLQDFRPLIAEKRHTLQLSVDIQNFLNMLNSSWGNVNKWNYGGFSDQGLVGVSGGKYTFHPKNVNNPVYSKLYGLGSTWRLQLGVRYIF